MDSTALIFNPAAGSSRRRCSADRAARLLSDAGFSVELLVTGGPGDAAALAARAAERHPVVAAIGGDGTVSEVARGLLGTRASLALLPGGSGNDFAWGMGIDTPEQGAAAAARRMPRRVDVGFFDDTPFVNSVGLLLSAEVSLRAASAPRFLSGARYLAAAAGGLLSHRPTRARWRLDRGGVLDGDWALIEVGNGPRCGGGYLLTPRADPADGLLDFCLARAMSRWDILRLLPRSLSGSHLVDPRVLMPRAAAAEVEFFAPFAVHVDGEARRLPAGAHVFRVEPGALSVLAPPPRRRTTA